MAEPQETTFSVIALAFPNDDELIPALSAAFGIDSEEATAIVARAPVRLRRGIDASAAKQFAGLLLSLGADLSIRNEQTGEERTYSAASRVQSASQAELTAESAPDADLTEEAVPYESAPPPQRTSASSRPPVAFHVAEGAGASPDAKEFRPSAALSLMEALRFARERADAGGGPRASRPSSTNIPAATSVATEPRAPSGPGPGPSPAPAHSPAARPSGTNPLLAFLAPQASNPGTDVAALPYTSPVPPVPAPGSEAESEIEAAPNSSLTPIGTIDRCASCSRVLEKGVKCPFCGWHNDTKKRHCRECGKEVRVAPGLTLRVGIAFGLIGLGASAAGYWFFHMLAGVGAGLLVLGAALAFDGFRSHYGCASCKRETDTSSLLPNETRRLRTARAKWIVYGTIFAIFGAALAIPSAAKTMTMSIASFGIGWHVTLPRTHTEFERSVFFLPTEFGSARVVAQTSVNSRRSIRTVALAQLVIPRETIPKVDEVALDRMMGQVVEKLMPGAKMGKSEPLPMKQAQAGRKAPFELTTDGAKEMGAAHVFQFDTNEIVVVLFAATPEEATAGSSGPAFLDSLTVERKSAL